MNQTGIHFMYEGGRMHLYAIPAGELARPQTPGHNPTPPTRIVVGAPSDIADAVADAGLARPTNGQPARHIGVSPAPPQIYRHE